MNWDAIGAIAELIGAVAVVVTLCFLAVQIRQNNRSVKASAAQSVIQSLANAYSTTAMSPELCRIVVVGAKDIASLTEHETAQLYMWLTSWFRLVEQAYLHYTMGNISETAWNGHLVHLRSALATQAIAAFWRSRQEIYSEEFRTFVDTLDVTDSATIDRMFSEFHNKDARTELR